MKRLCKNHGPQFRGHFEKVILSELNLFCLFSFSFLQVKQIKDAAKQPKNSSKYFNFFILILDIYLYILFLGKKINTRYKEKIRFQVSN